MRDLRKLLSDTSPAAASTAAGTSIVAGLAHARALTLVFGTVGATGGVLDVYLQTSYDGGATWYDYAHLTQLTAGNAAATRVWHVDRTTAASTMVTIGSGTSPALAANAINGGAWGDAMRFLFVAGASTSAGAATTCTVVAHYADGN
jgi:hypothetical protein